MKRLTPFTYIAGALLLMNQQAISQTIEYPVAHKGDVVEDYHGTTVADPYRWLEDPDSEETLTWVEANNKITEEYLNTPDHEKIKERLTEIWNYPKYSTPSKKGDWYVFSKNDGLQNQSVIYRQKSLDSEAEIVIDPNGLSEDGTVALTATYFNEDGNMMVYATSSGGSDWQEFRIRNLETGEDYEEIIQWVKFSGAAWKHDNSGFYYSRYPISDDDKYEAQNTFNKLYFHKLGTRQKDDVLIYERPDEEHYSFRPFLTDDGEYLMLSVGYPDFATSRYYVRPIESDGDFLRLLDNADAMYEFAGNEGSIFYFKTDLDAPNSRLIAIDINNPELDNWKTIIPEQKDVMDTVFLLNDQFVVNWKKDAHHVLTLYSKDAMKIKEIELPSLGAIGISSTKQDADEFFYTFTSFLYPSSTYRYDVKTGNTELVRETEIDFDASQFETKQVFYPSKDGTKIPMFITHKKGLKLDGSNPTLLYGYGGFDISLMPSFSISRTFWMEQGGVFALANLRGGSEFGKNWHEAGMLEKKQNVFDDFHAAAEYLISEKYTSNKKLAIQGGSNGGLLTATCMLQRPDLYGAVHSAVPVIDMLRFHKFTIGFYWTGEYGNAEENPDHFKFMYAYSPLHNIKEGVSYPPVLVTAADTDDRVVPSHAKKFVATLQEKAKKDNPILLRIETKAGHGAGKPTSKRIEEQADIYAFLFKQFGMTMN